MLYDSAAPGMWPIPKPVLKPLVKLLEVVRVQDINA